MFNNKINKTYKIEKFFDDGSYFELYHKTKSNHGWYFQIDEIDYKLIKDVHWTCHKVTNYFYHRPLNDKDINYYSGRRKQDYVTLHRLIISGGELSKIFGFEVHHNNGKKDHRRKSLYLLDSNQHKEIHDMYDKLGSDLRIDLKLDEYDNQNRLECGLCSREEFIIGKTYTQLHNEKVANDLYLAQKIKEDKEKKDKELLDKALSKANSNEFISFDELMMISKNNTTTFV